MKERQVRSLSLKYPLEEEWQPIPVFSEKPMERGARRATVQGVAESDTTEHLTRTPQNRTGKLMASPLTPLARIVLATELPPVRLLSVFIIFA